MPGKLFIPLFTLVLFLCSQHSKGQTKDTLSKSDLTDMSLEQLLELEIKIGTHTPTTLTEAPVSVTVIDKQEIGLTPARNLLDLIEVYVPGATYTNHWLGPRLGIRGVMGDQNTSYLLLLNNRNINMKTINGPFYEVQNRDLSDIEKIEIIRGPGSVTYGHGAIGGIINIKTLPETNENNLKIGVGGNGGYRYGNIFLKGGVTKSKWSLSYYGSINRSLGENSPEFFYIDRAHGYGYGFMGYQWGNKGLGTPAPNFYGDFWDKPQIKAQFNFKLGKILDVWTRYSDITYKKQQQLTNTIEGLQSPGLIGKQFLSVAKLTSVSKNNLSISHEIGFLSQSNRDVTFYNAAEAPIDHITQRNYSYSQNETFFSTIINYNVKNRLNIAIGGDLNYLYLGPEWGMKKNKFINSFPSPLQFVVYDTTSSGFYQKYGSLGIVNYVDDVIDGYQYSVFSEIKINPAPNFSILLSGRIDKHEYSDFAFSPRLALISNFSEKHIVKLIAQHAVRLPTFNELYTFNHLQGKKVKPEIKEGIQVDYNYLISKNIYFDFSTYYNSINQIAWTSAGYPDVVGTFNLIGADFQLKYQTQKNKWIVSYAFVHQNKWEPVTSMDAYVSNIGLDSVDITFPQYGNNRLNNIPEHSIKFNQTYTLKKNVRLHANVIYNWGYGQIDMLNMYKSIHENYGTEETKQEMANIHETVTSYGYGQASFTSNVSLSFKPDFLPSSEIYIYAMNLLQKNHIRYVFQYWEDGDNRQYPRQVGFIKEPTSIGIKWVWNVGK